LIFKIHPPPQNEEYTNPLVINRDTPIRKVWKPHWSNLCRHTLKSEKTSRVRSSRQWFRDVVQLMDGS